MPTTHVTPVPESFLGTLMTWHIRASETDGGFSLGEVTLHAGDEPPLHIHAREDEAWYILEGRILFQRGVERLECSTGEAIMLPRGIPHGFALQTPSARILHFYSPGGVESAFSALSAPVGSSGREVSKDEMSRIFEARGVTFVGPPLPMLLSHETTHP
jgi:quercetin dioxygenase-like cupin family protein